MAKSGIYALILTSLHVWVVKQVHVEGFSTSKALIRSRTRGLWRPLSSSSASQVYPEKAPEKRNDVNDLNKKLASVARTAKEKKRRLSTHSDPISKTIEGKSASTSTGSSEIPNTQAYNSILNSFGTTEDACRKAEMLLQKMKYEYDSGKNISCLPDTTTYNIVMKLWANSGRSDAGENSERILRLLWEDHECYKERIEQMNNEAKQQNQNQNKSKIAPPDQFSYSTVISAWARSRLGRKSAKNSERLLEEMNIYWKAGYEKLSPTTYVVNAVCNAWAKSADTEGLRSIERGEEILEKMEDLTSDGKRAEIRPNTISYNTIISAYAKNGEIERAERILRRMEQTNVDAEGCQPDAISYNSIINAWAKSDMADGGERAEAILRQMERQSGIQPDRISYKSVVNAFAQRGKPEMAESVLIDMVDAYQKGNNDLKPTILSFNTVCNSFAKSRNSDAADRAMALLHRMESLQNSNGEYFVKPDIYTYTSVLDAISKQGTPESAQKAIDLLGSVEAKYAESKLTSIKPNVRTYTSVINAISRSRRNPQRAEDILNRMEQMNADDDSINIEIDTVCYNAVLKSWGWSSEPDKAYRANKIFCRMLEQFASEKNRLVKPNLVSLNSLLNACFFSPIAPYADDSGVVPTSNLVLEIAMNAYELFERDNVNYEFPDDLIYGQMLMIYNKLLPEGKVRTDMIKKIFEKCCERGHLSLFVVGQLQFGAGFSRNKVKNLLGDGFVVGKSGKVSMDRSRVPKEWYENVSRTTRRHHDLQYTI